jgi:phosphoribosylaminoimidazolecarboxamide formyltransferase / IMP cyclohydrolase
MTTKPSIKRALLSVADKEGLVLFAKQLQQLNIDIIATGGTAKLLTDADIPVIAIQDITGFPEIMNGRVKTLHPKVHGAILGRRGTDEATMLQHDMTPIDLVAVNLYPFEKTIRRPDHTREDAIENIDIGGPTLLRAAAKNQDAVTVIVDPNDYQTVLDEITSQQNTSAQTRQYLAQKAFAHTAHYDSCIANYLNPTNTKTISLTEKQTLRYGENPHQKATRYEEKNIANTLMQAYQHQGKPLSFNNLMDSNAALSCVRALDPTSPGCVIVKHATPCGVAQGDSLEQAYEKALSTDATSAFGGIIAFNQAVNAATAQRIIDQQFAEVIIAPRFDDDALSLFTNKKNCRVLSVGDQPGNTHEESYHSISGGLLIQEADELPDDSTQFTVVTERQPSPAEMADGLFAWNVVRYVKSNAIVYAKDRQTLGIGTGQTSRVFSAKIAAIKAEEAKLSLKGAAMASDAFFPFADGVEVAANAGITCVIQPGGSKRDNEVIAAANRLGLTMIFTHTRHFKH